MAYHGYIPIISKFAYEINAKTNNTIRLLEVGVDTGISLFALINNLNTLCVPFEYTGVDIKIQNHLLAIPYMFLHAKNETKINLEEQNSLDYLSSIDSKFDIILLDGDHNYETVSQECNLLKNLIHEDTLIVCDDYDGRWSKKDLYYASRKNYEDNKLATKKTKDFKMTGIKPAIDEFVNENVDIVSFKLMEGEPIVLANKNNQYLNLKRV